MTKRDTQASEYAAEAYGKTSPKRCVSHMEWALTDEEREAIENMLHLIATKHEDYGKEAYMLRNLLERTT
jgi:hypothetical protein